jgi:hypothetical protein
MVKARAGAAGELHVSRGRSCARTSAVSEFATDMRGMRYVGYHVSDWLRGGRVGGR